MKNFGKKLRKLRNQRGLTLRELSMMLDVDYGYIGRMERGEKKPNVAMVLKISQIFNISTDVLIKDELELED